LAHLIDIDQLDRYEPQGLIEKWGELKNKEKRL